MKKFLLSLLVLLATAPFLLADTYTGVVSDMKEMSGGSVAINLDGKYPDQKMTLFIKGSDKGNFTRLPQVGDTVTAVGTITTYKDKPEIVLEKQEQLTWADGSAASTNAPPAQ